MPVPHRIYWSKLKLPNIIWIPVISMMLPHVKRGGNTTWTKLYCKNITCGHWYIRPDHHPPKSLWSGLKRWQLSTHTIKKGYTAAACTRKHEEPHPVGFKAVSHYPTRSIKEGEARKISTVFSCQRLHEKITKFLSFHVDFIRQCSSLLNRAFSNISGRASLSWCLSQDRWRELGGWWHEQHGFL